MEESPRAVDRLLPVLLPIRRMIELGIDHFLFNERRQAGKQPVLRHLLDDPIAAGNKQQRRRCDGAGVANSRVDVSYRSSRMLTAICGEISGSAA